MEAGKNLLKLDTEGIRQKKTRQINVDSVKIKSETSLKEWKGKKKKKLVQNICNLNNWLKTYPLYIRNYEYINKGKCIAK